MNKNVIIQKLNTIGGIIQVISLLLPTIFIITEFRNTSGFILMWLFGLAFMDFKPQALYGFYFIPDAPLYFGSIISIILLYIGMVCVRKESADLKIFGIISIILIVSYYVGLYIVYIIIQSLIGSNKFEILIIPFTGFFGIILGASLVIFSSIRSEK